MNQKIEPIILLLAGMVILFAFTLIGVAKFMTMDGQTFQVISGLVTGFPGALLMRVKPRSMVDSLPDGSTTTTNASIQSETITPPMQ